MGLFRMFKKYKAVQPLPTFEAINLSKVPSGSILLFYGSPGNKLTQMVGNNMYHHPYTPPAFHAALYIENGLFLNVGKYKLIQALEHEFRSTRRVDVIIPLKMDAGQRKTICKLAYLDTSKPKVGINLPDYSWTDYLRFGARFLKPSKKDFCSENVVELMNAAGVEVTKHKPVDTAPWHLLEHALASPQDFKIRTVHTGDEFKP